MAQFDPQNKAAEAQVAQFGPQSKAEVTAQQQVPCQLQMPELKGAGYPLEQTAVKLAGCWMLH